MSTYPRLDDDGLLYYSQQLKTKMQAMIPGDMVGAGASTNGSHGLVPQPNAGQNEQFLRGDGTWATPPGTTDDATQSTHGLMSAADKTKLDGIDTGAEVNTIEGIQRNGTDLTPDSVTKKVNVIVPTAVSDLTNDSGYQTASDVATAIDQKIAMVYKPGGSIAFANLPTLDVSHLGYVYNITDSFTTTSDFVEGAGKTFAAGTDVAIVDVGSSGSPSYKYNVFGSFVNLSGYVQSSEMTTLSTTDIDTIITSVFG